MTPEMLIKIWESNQWGFYEGDTQGVVGFDGELSVKRLKEAYSVGVFPWPQNKNLIWFCPQQRGVLFFEELSLHKRLIRKYRSSEQKYKFTINTAFNEVILECAKAPRRGQSGTWITEEMLNAYNDFNKAGCILSFECWNKDKLVGGLYGVRIWEEEGDIKKLKLFSGESVFGHESDVAKFCFIKCIEYLRGQGLTWMDIQMVTNLTEDFGGRYISRSEYLKLIIDKMAT